jgi:NADH dehydrogenase
MRNLHHVVIIGGGFGGLFAARGLGRAPVRVTLIDRRNFHLFQPLLYQVATGGLSPANIAAPLRGIVRRQKNTTVLLADVRTIDVAGRTIPLPSGEVRYDTLIVATGVRHNYFGNDHWEALAPGLKTIEDATEIRARILGAFEAAEASSDVEEIRALLTFVVIGAGPTGVELAGTLAEIARDTLKRDFRTIDPTHARILLLDAIDRVLPPYPPSLSAKAAHSLRRLGVTVMTGVKVCDIQPGFVAVQRDTDTGAKPSSAPGDAHLETRNAGLETRSTERPDPTERVATRTVLWAAGVRASSFGRVLADRTGSVLDDAGRLFVAPDLTIPGHPEIFVIGDLACFTHPGGKPLPGVAPVAIQQGRYVAEVIRRRVHAERRSLPPPMPAPFRYHDRGSMATIGRAAAVADFGWARFSGYLAWLLWLFVHLLFLIGFQNRVLVFIQWAWNYFSFNRSARLITGAAPERHGDAGE